MNHDIVVLREVVSKLTPLLAGKGLQVTQRGTQARVEYDTRTGKPVCVNIPFIPDNASDELILAIQGFIDHEVAHILFTEYDIMAEALEDAPLKLMHNVVEDTFIERAMGEKFPGSVYNVRKLHEFFVRHITVPALEKVAGSPQDEFSILLVPLFRAWAGQEVFIEFMKDHWEQPLIKAFVERMPREAVEKIPHIKSTREAMDIAVIADRILNPPLETRLLVPIVQLVKDQPVTKPIQPVGAYLGKKPYLFEIAPHLPEGLRFSSDGELTGTPEGTGGPWPFKVTVTDRKGDTSDQTFMLVIQESSESGGDPGEDDSEGGTAKDETKKKSKGKTKPPPKGEDEGDASDEKPGDGATGAKSKKARKSDEDEGKEGEDEAEADEADPDGAEEPGAEDAVGDGDDSMDDGGAEKPGDDSGETDPDEGGSDEEAEDDGDGAGEEDEADADEGGEGGGSTSEEEGGEPDDSTGSKVGGGTEPPPDDASPFCDFTPDPKDFSEGVAEKIAEDAMEDVREAPYAIYTKDFDRVEPCPVDEAKYRDTWMTRLDDDTRHMVGKMQKDIERMMAAQSQVLRVPGYRSGRLHSAGLHRLMANDDRVFRRIHEQKSKDTAVSLLVDCSGSMSYGGKFKTAVATAFALSSTLERVNISHECIGFTTYCARIWASGRTSELARMFEDAAAEETKLGRRFARVAPIYMPIFKGFGEKLTPAVKRRFAQNYMSSSIDLEENLDGEAIETASIRLMQRKEKRKVLIVLSDGSPVCPGDRRAQVAKVHMAIKQANKAGVETIGIGIMDTSVTTFYPKHIVLNDLASLPTTVMGELTKILTR